MIGQICYWVFIAYVCIAAAHFVFIAVVYLALGGTTTWNDKPAPQFVVMLTMSLCWPLIKWKVR